jgi:prepilin-type N-terminal cleavage/methylation domain-containing protein
VRSRKELATWHSLGSRGMTLLELMVAMLILLVGIWTIATGFPTLLASVTAEGEKTEMTRLAERQMERVKGSEGALPMAITGGPLISPYSEPEDLEDPARPANSQENVLDVIGESFTIPGAQAEGASTQGSSAYVLQQGPAEWSDYPETDSLPFVYVLVPLTEQRRDPRSGGNQMLGNSFYVDESTGEIMVPPSVYTYDGSRGTAWSVGGLLINYAWAETGGVSNRPPVHYVQDEKVSSYTGTGSYLTYVVRASVRASGSHDFAGLVEGKTAVQAIVYFDREPFGTSLPTTRGRYVLNNDYGVELRFHRDDAGLNAYVDYRLRDVFGTNQIGSSVDPSRRKLMMIEDHVINSDSVRTDDDTGDRFTDVKLATGGLNDETPLFEHDLSGTTLGNDVYLLAVDLTGGQIYQYDSLGGINITLHDETLSPKLSNGFRDGVVAVRLDAGGTLQPYVGHTMRFYYCTLEHHNVQLQRPARTFVDVYTAETYTPNFAAAGEEDLLANDYRTYRVVQQELTAPADMDRVVIEFVGYVDDDGSLTLVDSRAVEGHTISVDYVWYDAADKPHYVYGEMHTVPAGANSITLQHFSYHRSDDYSSAEIIAVRGVSARTVVWWLTAKGRQQKIALDSYTLKSPLAFTHRIR